MHLMKGALLTTIAAIGLAHAPAIRAAEYPVRLITLDPGHFHAGLVQKFMYPQVSPEVNVYSPGGPELQDHLQRIESFNTRAENPTKWETRVHTGPDFLQQMIRDRAGNVVVISGNNLRKTEYINKSIKAGFNVLADKPMAITPADFKLLRKTFALAEKKHVLLYDIMTERFEITSLLQRDFALQTGMFGTLAPGTPEKPAVYKESVHHYSKEVAGKPLVRPPWFFDVQQQGEAVPDVGTHLVDLVQWSCFPDVTLDWKKDAQVLDANRWDTKLTRAQFNKATGLDDFPAYLKPNVDANGILHVYSSGDVTWRLKGMCAKVKVIWNFEAPPGAKDMHYSIMRGTRANLVIRQAAEQKFVPTLYIENASGEPAEVFGKTIQAAAEAIAKLHPGVTVEPEGREWKVIVPEKYNVGHEAHFGAVTENFLKYLAQGRLPAWEVPNMITKYYVTTEAYKLSHQKR